MSRETILLDALLKSGDVRFDKNDSFPPKYLEKKIGTTEWMLLGFEGEELSIEKSLKRRIQEG